VLFAPSRETRPGTFPAVSRLKGQRADARSKETEP
jgi:hypothetical protein